MKFLSDLPSVIGILESGFYPPHRGLISHIWYPVYVPGNKTLLDVPYIYTPKNNQEFYYFSIL